MSKGPGLKIVELPAEEWDAFLGRVRGSVAEGDYQIIASLIKAVALLLRLVGWKNMSIARLRRMVFGPKTEKSAKILPPSAPPPAAGPAAQKPKRKGHGRHGAGAYTGAARVRVAYPGLAAGDRCPKCPAGHLYAMTEAVVLYVKASPMFQATKFALDHLRCAACGAVFTAPAPPETLHGTYDPSVGVMLALTRYGAGQPNYRTAKCQEWFGVPLPASVQWELVNAAAPAPEAVYEALQDEAAQAALLHNDDTTMRVRSLGRGKSPGPAKAGRSGVFTTSVIAQTGSRQIALFFTGRNHAGENLGELLRRRAAGLPPPLQMCDALSRNEPKGCPTDLRNCIPHGRRNFVDLLPSFPEEARKVIESLAEIFRFEAKAKENKLSDGDRLAFHQAHSKPVMDELKKWMRAQLDERKVEPNSGLGQAIRYMLKHWTALTRFLAVPGAPLDNNICERALKMAIQHRKNSLGYKTERGARVGDTFMSLIHTCQLGRINPFHYLMALVTNAKQVLLDPKRWLPWNYPVAPSPDTG